MTINRFDGFVSIGMPDAEKADEWFVFWFDEHNKKHQDGTFNSFKKGLDHLLSVEPKCRILVQDGTFKVAAQPNMLLHEMNTKIILNFYQNDPTKFKNWVQVQNSTATAPCLHSTSAP